MTKAKFSWKWILIGIAAAGLLAIAGCGVQGFGASSGAQEMQVGYVTSVTVTDTVEANGTLQATQTATLLWETSGTVAQVTVQPGEQVAAGQVLAILDMGSVSPNVISAQASLVAAEERLEGLLAPDEQAMAGIEVGLAAAFADWDAARLVLREAMDAARSSGDDDLYNDFLEAEEALDNALNALPLPVAEMDTQAYYRAAWLAALDENETSLAAQEALAEVLDGDTLDLADDLVDAQREVEWLAEDFSTSLESESNAHADALDLSAALSGYNQATAALMDAIQARYELVHPDADDLLQAQADVDAARATLESVQVIAPFSGEVLEVYSASGDTVTTGAMALLLVDRSSLKVKAEVEEDEIARVFPGQAVEIELDGLPGTLLTGVVDYANPQGYEAAGLVNYTVWVVVDDPGKVVPLGGNASLTIWTGEPQAALAAPLPAIQYDSQGEYVMRVGADGSLQRVAVVSGNFVGDLIAVEGALQTGDVVQLVQAEGATVGAMQSLDMGQK